VEKITRGIARFPCDSTAFFSFLLNYTGIQKWIIK